jgi:DNA-directed RNA polymerase subunit RPC12/RpoP
MTRFCIRCNRIIGEKCVQCGTQVTASSNGHALTGGDFDCPSCGHHFLQGDGGETGGMCEPCFDAELQKAHEQAAKSRVEDAGLGLATGNRHPANDPPGFGR